MRGLLVLIVSLAVSACAPALNSQLVRSPLTVADDPDHPELALLEVRLAEHFGKFGATPPTTCAGFTPGTSIDRRKLGALSAEDEQRLMLRFPDLAPFDRCKPIDNGPGTKFFVDSITGEPAAMFDVHQLECSSPTRCRAYAGYTLDQQRNGWRFYEARFADGKWRVRKQDLDIIVT